MLQRLRRLQADERFGEILTGSAFALAARAVAAVCGVAVNVVVARWYGADLVGVVAMVQSFLFFGTTFALLGTGTSMLRLIPEHLAKYSVASAFHVYRMAQRLVVVLSLLVGGLLFSGSHAVAAGLFRKPHLSEYFACASLFFVFEALGGLSTAAARGLRLIRTFALMQVLVPVLGVGFLYAGLSLSASGAVPIYAYLAAVAVTGATGAVLVEMVFRRRVRTEDQVHPVGFGQLMSISIPMMLTSGMTLVMTQVGVFYLGIFRTEAEVGYFAVAVKLATVTLFMLAAVNSMAAPRFSELYHRDRLEDLFYVARNTAKLVFWATAPLLIGLIAFGWWILRYFFGSPFSAAYPALALLTAGQFVNAMSGSTGMFMNMTGLQKEYHNIVVAVGIITLTTSVPLIQAWGVTGAALSSTVATAGLSFLGLLVIRRRFGRTALYLPSFWCRQNPRKLPLLIRSRSVSRWKRLLVWMLIPASLALALGPSLLTAKARNLWSLRLTVALSRPGESRGRPLVELGAGHPRGALALARQEARSGDPASALAWLEELRGSVPSSWLEKGRGEALAAQRKWDEARAAWEAAGDPLALKRAGEMALAEGRSDDAIALHESWYRLDPERAAVPLARLVYRMGENPAGAAQIIERALQSCLTAPIALRLEWLDEGGTYYRAAKMWPNAEWAYRRILALSPHDVRWRIGMAWLRYQRDDDMGGAIRLLMDAIQRSPAEARPWAVGGTILLREGRYTKAVHWLSNAIERGPGGAWLYLYRALAVREAGDVPRSLDLLRDLVVRFPDFAEAYYELGWTQSLVGDHAEAADTMERALKVDETKNAAHIIRAAKVFERAGRVNQLRLLIKRSLGTRPESAHVSPVPANLHDTNRMEGTLEPSLDTAKDY